MLAVDKRYSEAPRSLSQVFWHCCDEISDTSFTQILAVLLDALHEFLHDNIGLSDDDVSRMVGIFIDKVAFFLCAKLEYIIDTCKAMF
jgi:hypothetical protein